MGRPVVHCVVPAAQGAPGLVVQEAPLTQGVQICAGSQTWLVPQLAPTVLGAPSTHVRRPAVQAVIPAKHGLGFVAQASPGAQRPQKPAPSQIAATPQTSPAFLGSPSAHTEAPEPHDVTPKRHFDGLVPQLLPASQLTQLPLLLQTSVPPHSVPVGACFASMHVGVPVAQEVSPSKQVALGLLAQDSPAAHSMQTPAALQTLFSAHDWPALLPWQTLGSWQLPLWHWPSSHTTPTQVTSTQAPPTQAAPSRHTEAPHTRLTQLP